MYVYVHRPFGTWNSLGFSTRPSGNTMDFVTTASPFHEAFLSLATLVNNIVNTRKRAHCCPSPVG